METLGMANFRVMYNQKDISSDLKPNLLSIKYTDHTDGKADELSITLENVDAFWENEWYPKKGDKLSCEIGYEALMNCGTFEIDEIEISSIPDLVTIKAISATVTGSMRTNKSTAHENTTLKDIVNKVAADNGLQITGDIAAIQFSRITQFRESDLSFLQRLARQFGYHFSVRDKKLVFTSLYGIFSNGSVESIDRENCISYTIKDQSAKIIRKSNVSSFDHKKQKKVSYEYTPTTTENEEGDSYFKIDQGGLAGTQFLPTGMDKFSDEGFDFSAFETEDSAEMFTRIENDGQAESMAKSSLLQSSTNQQEGSISVQGNPLLVAGSNFQFTGIGKLSGKYHISTSDHDISASGYVTNLEVKRVGYIELVKGKRKKAATPKNYEVKVVK